MAHTHSVDPDRAPLERDDLDEQLQGALGSLADRFHEQLGRELRQVAADVAARLRADREAVAQQAAARAQADADRRAEARLQTAVAEAEARVRAAAEQQAREARERAEAEARAAAAAAEARLQAAVADAETRGRREAERAAHEELERAERRAAALVDLARTASRDEARAALLGATSRLIDGVRQLDRARSLTQILEALVDAAGRHAPRAALLVRRGGELGGWRFAGFSPEPDPAAVRIAADAGGVLGEAVRTRRPISAVASGPFAPPFAPMDRGIECVAVPLLVGGEVVGILYGDSGADTSQEERRRAQTWVGAVELLVRHAARCLEVVTALTALRVLGDRIGGGPAAADRPAAGQAADEAAARQYAQLLVSGIELYPAGEDAQARREPEASGNTWRGSRDEARIGRRAGAV